MKTISTEWTLGNFAVALNAEVVDKTFELLAACGLKWLGQRQTEVDRVLGGFTKVGGKDKRKANWKRTDVEYSSDLANRLCEVFGEMELAENVNVDCEVSVTEYIREAPELKFKEAKVVIGNHESKGDLDEWAKAKLGYEGETHTADGEEYSEELLKKCHEYIKAERAKQMESL